MSADTDTLAALVGDREHFANQIWNQRAIVRRGVDGAVWKNLLTVDELDSLIASRRVDIQIIQDGTWVDPEEFTERVYAAPMLSRTSVINPGEVFDRFNAGATVVLHGLHEWWPKLDRFCADLNRSLSMAVQANAYIAPPALAGHRHHDLHHVIILQLHGTKRWTVEQRRCESDGSNPDDVEVLEVELGPGDCLYVPRKFPHRVETTDAYSTHITFGVMAPSWGDAVRALSQSLLEEELEDVPLTPGFADATPGDLDAAASAALARIRDFWSMTPEHLAGEVLRRFVAKPPTTWERQFTSLLATRSLDDDIMIVRRPGPASVEEDGSYLRFAVGERSVEMPSFLRPVCEHLTHNAVVRLGDLFSMIDPASARVLVRRLAQEGLIEV